MACSCELAGRVELVEVDAPTSTTGYRKPDVEGQPKKDRGGYLTPTKEATSETHSLASQKMLQLECVRFYNYPCKPDAARHQPIPNGPPPYPRECSSRDRGKPMRMSGRDMLPVLT